MATAGAARAMIEGQENPVHDAPVARRTTSFDIEAGAAPEVGDQPSATGAEHSAERPGSATPPLMDSRQPPCIRVRTFVWQFVMHMLPYPLNVLFYPPSYRKYGPRNQLLTMSWRALRAMGVRSALQWFDYERLRTALLWTNVALFAMHRAEFRRCEVSASEILGIPLFTVAMHRVMVALKYAMLASQSGMKLRPRPSPSGTRCSRRPRRSASSRARTRARRCSG